MNSWVLNSALINNKMINKFNNKSRQKMNYLGYKAVMN